jgi:hypothetical protein
VYGIRGGSICLAASHERKHTTKDRHSEGIGRRRILSVTDTGPADCLSGGGVSSKWQSQNWEGRANFGTYTMRASSRLADEHFFLASTMFRRRQAPSNAFSDWHGPAIVAPFSPRVNLYSVECPNRRCTLSTAPNSIARVSVSVVFDMTQLLHLGCVQLQWLHLSGLCTKPRNLLFRYVAEQVRCRRA